MEAQLTVPIPSARDYKNVNYNSKAIMRLKICKHCCHHMKFLPDRLRSLCKIPFTVRNYKASTHTTYITHHNTVHIPEPAEECRYLIHSALQYSGTGMRGHF
jgi:hypothetical protein